MMVDVACTSTHPQVESTFVMENGKLTVKAKDTNLLTTYSGRGDSVHRQQVNDHETRQNSAAEYLDKCFNGYMFAFRSLT